MSFDYGSKQRREFFRAYGERVVYDERYRSEAASGADIQASPGWVRVGTQQYANCAVFSPSLARAMAHALLAAADYAEKVVEPPKE